MNPRVPILDDKREEVRGNSGLAELCENRLAQKPPFRNPDVEINCVGVEPRIYKPGTRRASPQR